jgi:hypothetical protein
VSPGFNHIGFTDPRQRPERRRAVALAQLIATVALVLSIAVAATVVSIGIARACAPATPAADASHPSLSHQPVYWQVPAPRS